MGLASTLTRNTLVKFVSLIKLFLLDDLTDLTARLTVRADGGHAPPLGLSGKPFRLTIILPSALVRFPVSNPIEPHDPPLVCPPANSLKFHPFGRTPQAAHLTPSLRHRVLPRSTPHQVGIVYAQDFPAQMGSSSFLKGLDILHIIRRYSQPRTGVSNPDRSPGFRPSPSGLFQAAAFATHPTEVGLKKTVRSFSIKNKNVVFFFPSKLFGNSSKNCIFFIVRISISLLVKARSDYNY